MTFYGVAYRPNPKRGDGFQPPRRRSPDRRPIKPYRPLRTPAPGAKPFRFGAPKRAAKAFGKRGLEKAVMRSAWKLPFRLNPWAGAIALGLDLIPWQIIDAPPQMDWAAAGFTLCCDLGLPTDSFCTNVSRSCLNVCGVSGQVPCYVNGTDLNTVTGGSIGRIREYATTGGGPNQSPWRGTVIRVWYRPDVWKNPFPPVPLKYPTPVYQPSPMPIFTPFPENIPIGVPMPFPLHTPYPRIPKLPKRSPWPQGREQREPKYVRDPRLGPRGDPGAQPGVEYSPGKKPRPAPAHEYKPPEPNEREKKGRVKGGTKIVKEFADQLGKYGGESADAINAVYSALGKKCGSRTPQAKLKCIYDNIDTLDLDKAIKELALNQIEDAILGKIGKALGKTARENPYAMRDPGRGYQAGGAGARYHQLDDIKQIADHFTDWIFL